MGRRRRQPFGHRRTARATPARRRARWLAYAADALHGGRSMAAVVLACAALAAGPALAAPSSDECLACHGATGFADDAGRALFISGDAFAASVHAMFSCTDCHADAAEIPHAGKLQAVALDRCASCHADAVAAYRDGVHARIRDGAQVGCADCHGPIHAIVSRANPAAPVHWSQQPATCARCHANVARVRRSGMPVVQPVEAYLEGVHGRAVAAGTRAAVCADCHGAHAILPAADPQSTIWRANVPGTCGGCHADVLAEYRDSVHGAALAHGVREAPVCTDCHGEHRILASSDPASPVFAGNIPRETCGRCHGDLRLAAKYGLPSQNVAAFEDSFHGLALRSGQVGVANCASCHGVHGILPSSDPRSLVNPANLPTTCGKCHPGAGTSFAIGTVHLPPATGSGRVETWVRLVYRWAIVLVIGFMAIHNAVDFAVKARHWPPPPRSPRPLATERMSRPLRWQHGLIMSSFPVLVYTGFALIYPESWWAAPLLRWESRLGLRGLLHRAAAVVLLSALVWHAAHWWMSRTLRAQLRGLRPSWRDGRDLAARFAYYAGWRATAPRSGAFSYIEKLEYWAFIWGMLIMTASGVPLWFSDVTLRYLPKWMSDVATAIHFYEAVLATLAIAVWHLYWVMFDPEVYPMDWSWWDGRAPTSRSAERQGAADAETTEQERGRSE